MSNRRRAQRLPIRGEYSERGQLRSGERFAARNLPFYTNVRDLLRHHKRLFSTEPAVSQRYFYIGGPRASLRGRSLIQTTVRYRSDYPDILQHLKSIFVDLFREHSENSTDGFEVVTTFNAILSNPEQTTFSVYYGHDHRANNLSGAASELQPENGTVIVRQMPDVNSIPATFDFEQLARLHRQSFADSNVAVYKFINIVYLIYRFVKRDRPSQTR